MMGWLMLVGAVVILGALIIYVLYVVSMFYPKEAPKDLEDPVIRVVREEVPCYHCGCKRLDYLPFPNADEYRCANCGTLRVRLGVL